MRIFISGNEWISVGMKYLFQFIYKKKSMHNTKYIDYNLWRYIGFVVY